MSTAAFQATYSDWRLVRSRKVCQVVLEIPLEQATQVLDCLGGMPNPASEVWVGVARLKDGAARDASREPDNDPCNLDAPAPAKSARAPRSWHEMTPAQQAGILCADVPFQNFMLYKIGGLNPRLQISEAVIQRVREICGVKSRADILFDTPSAKKWHTLVSDYRAYMKEPECVG